MFLHGNASFAQNSSLRASVCSAIELTLIFAPSITLFDHWARAVAEDAGMAVHSNDAVKAEAS